MLDESELSSDTLLLALTELEKIDISTFKIWKVLQKAIAS